MVDQTWVKTSTSTVLDQATYTYDRNGNRTAEGNGVDGTNAVATPVREECGRMPNVKSRQHYLLQYSILVFIALLLIYGVIVFFQSDSPVSSAEHTALAVARQRGYLSRGYLAYPLRDPDSLGGCDVQFHFISQQEEQRSTELSLVLSRSWALGSWSVTGEWEAPMLK